MDVPPSPVCAPRVDVLLDPAWLDRQLRADARRGLAATPKELPPKWFYDERGSRLFDAITRLPEYYPTRTERRIIAARAAEIADLAGPRELVELGSGTSEKTTLLLDALVEAGLRRFVPFDVSEVVLREAADGLATRYPELEVHAFVGDFEAHLGDLPPGRDRMVAFLGSTIGNFPPVRRRAFLGTVASVLAPGDWLLLGLDLVKDRGRLERAYDDAAGVTAAFNLNVLRVLNRELDATFDPTLFEHVARWDEENEWIEMALRSRVDQRVTVGRLGLEVAFAAGEELRTEISAKFRRARAEAELEDAGLRIARWWPDPHGDFALLLARRV